MRGILPSMAIICMLAIISVPTVMAEDPIIPSTPHGLVAESGISYVDLSWQPSDFSGIFNGSHYSVYRGTDQDNIERIYNVSSNITAFHDSSVEEGTSYLYYVTAVIGENESGPSNAVSVTIPERERSDALLPTLALVISAIALQMCVLVFLVYFKTKMR